MGSSKWWLTTATWKRPNVSEILEACGGSGLQIDLKDVSFYLGRETFVVGGESALSHWRKQLFLSFSLAMLDLRQNF